MDSDVIQRINANRQHMSKGHKRIADYTVSNYDSAAFMTAATLGEKADVSESTVVRFAMSLGYDGYTELQKSLQGMVRNKLTNLQRIDLSSGKGKTAANVLKSDMNNIRATIEGIDPAVFDDAIECILASKTIYIVGHRSSSVLSRFLAYYLDFIFPSIRELQPMSHDAFDQLTRVGEGDLIIGISFPRYSALTVECVRIAREKGAKVLAITDSRLSPLVPLADYYLYAQSAMASFVDSLVAPLSLLNAIIVACGSSREEKVREHFEELERIWAQHNVYSEDG